MTKKTNRSRWKIAIYASVTLVLLGFNLSKKYEANTLGNKLDAETARYDAKTARLFKLQEMTDEANKLVKEQSCYEQEIKKILFGAAATEFDAEQLLCDNNTTILIFDDDNAQVKAKVFTTETDPYEFIFEVSHQVSKYGLTAGMLGEVNDAGNYRFAAPIKPNTWNTIGFSFPDVITHNVDGKTETIGKLPKFKLKKSTRAQLARRAASSNVTATAELKKNHSFFGKLTTDKNGLCEETGFYKEFLLMQTKNSEEILCLRLYLQKNNKTDLADRAKPTTTD